MEARWYVGKPAGIVQETMKRSALGPEKGPAGEGWRRRIWAAMERIAGPNLELPEGNCRGELRPGMGKATISVARSQVARCLDSAMGACRVLDAM